MKTAAGISCYSTTCSWFTKNLDLTLQVGKAELAAFLS